MTLAFPISTDFNLVSIDEFGPVPLGYLKNAQGYVSLEDGSVYGGAGSAVQEFCSNNQINIKSKLFGIPDRFIEHASREEMLEDSGLLAKQIIDSLKEWI